MNHAIEDWDVKRAAELAALAGAALPAEELSEDELVACCWDDPDPGSAEVGTVLGLADGTGAVALVWRPPEPPADAGGAHRPGAFVKFIAVHPDARRQGRAHQLLGAAE